MEDSPMQYFRRWLLKPVLKELRKLMSSYAEVQALLAAGLAATQANTNTLDSALTFIAGINDGQAALKRQIADLQAQIAAGSAITQEQLDNLGAGAQSLVDATGEQTAKEAILLNAVDGDPAPSTDQPQPDAPADPAPQDE
jgi:uncharacterized phage infection (PIP) family protein YhgE